MNNNNSATAHQTELIKKIRRSSNVGLYGSILVVLITVIFHFCPYAFANQEADVQHKMLLGGTILAVLAVVVVLLTLRKTTPRIRLMDQLDAKLEAYASYISSLYLCTFIIVIIECALICLMSDTSLLMVIMLLVLLLFLSYPNMYKMKHDLGLEDDTMKALFGDDYIADPVAPDAEPDLNLADAKLAQEAEESEDGEIVVDDSSHDASCPEPQSTQAPADSKEDAEA